MLNNKICKTEDVLVDGLCAKFKPTALQHVNCSTGFTNMLNDELNVDALCSTDQIDAD